MGNRWPCNALATVDYSCVAYYSLLIAMIPHVSSCLSPFLDCDPPGCLLLSYPLYQILSYVSLHILLPGYWLSVRGLQGLRSTMHLSYNYAMISTLIKILSYASRSNVFQTLGPLDLLKFVVRVKYPVNHPNCEKLWQWHGAMGLCRELRSVSYER